DLADITIYVIDVAGGEKIPRKGGPGITRSDLLIINKMDLAPHVGANLDVMRADAEKQRGSAPFLFTDLRRRIGVHEIIAFLEENGGLSPRLAAESRSSGSQASAFFCRSCQALLAVAFPGPAAGAHPHGGAALFRQVIQCAHPTCCAASSGWSRLPWRALAAGCSPCPIPFPLPHRT